MTPAANPSMASSIFFEKVLKKITVAAPAAVASQVNSVAKRACIIGPRPSNHSIRLFMENPLSVGFLFKRSFWFVDMLQYRVGTSNQKRAKNYLAGGKSGVYGI
jgi:hypothetical protein